MPRFERWTARVSGQQPSSSAHALIAWTTHSAVHPAALPTRTFGMHASALAAHEVGHEPGGSQVSPASITPLLQLALPIV